MDRRSFLKTAGAITVVVSAGQVWRSFAQEPDETGAEPELEPWRTWQQDSGRGSLALVRAAILSANAYNSQPWIFRVSDTAIDVYADERRNLGAFDPYLREMVFSIGCALENLALAARADGYEARIETVGGALSALRAEGKPALVSHIELRRGRREASDLYRAIPHRHTNREPFDSARRLPVGFVRELRRTTARESAVRVFTFEDRKEIERMVDVIASCSGKFLGDNDVRSSVRPWIRTTPAQMRKLRDGVLLDAKASRSGSLEAYASIMRTGRLFGLIAVRDRYDRAQTVRAGRVWQRAHLLATARGIAARPANGAVELMDHERRLALQPQAAGQLAQFTRDAAWQPTFMFYMGYPTVPAKASPRRRVEDVELKPA